MSEKPKAIVMTALVRNGEILLLKRVKPPYAGYWSVPGGKIEFGEHPAAAAIREFEEETGLSAEFKALRGVASETVKGAEDAHFILFFCELEWNGEGELKHSDEGECRFFKLGELDKIGMLPSDFLMVKEFLLENKRSLPIHEIVTRSEAGEYSVEIFRGGE